MTTTSHTKTKKFQNREKAGKELAKQILKYKKDSPIIVALPRGGVVTAFEIAAELKAPLEILVVRKIGSPLNKEFGIGAIAEGDVLILNNTAIEMHGIEEEDVNMVAGQELDELQRRITLYRKDQPISNFKDRVVVLVDDGVATGITAIAAIKAIMSHGPKKIVFASPVCAQPSSSLIKNEVEEIVCLQMPDDLEAIGNYYEEFEQITDEAVIKLIEKAGKL